MNTLLSILQMALACAFLGVGLVKVTQPRERLAARMGWVNDFASGPVKTIGFLEMLAALGLILPGVLDVAPVLTTWAAIGLTVLMIGAAVTHARRKEPLLIAPTLLLAALAAVVAWGRFGSFPL